jgi:RNA polymerase sigma factor for flagellar operon FliA
VSDDSFDVADESSMAEASESQPELWSEWCQTRALYLRDRLIEYYLPLARMVAGKLYRLRVQGGVQFDDYLQYARIGLIESVERFDPARGTPFRAFAFHRIRGAILNGIARESELAAQREASRRVGQERRESLLSGLSRSVERASLDDLVDLTIGIALGVLLEGGEESVVDETPQANPYLATEILQLRRLTRIAVERLPEREREIIRVHYYEHKEFREMAQALSLSAGRISQLHARAIRQLRIILANEPKLNRQI